MKEQKNPSIRKRRKSKKQRILLRFFPYIALMTGCLAVIISIAGNVFDKESISDKSVADKIVFVGTIPESSGAKMDRPQNGAEPLEMRSTDTLWYLTLVNSRNPLPENYMEHPIDLVDVPGGEQVDERIYEPLMEMLDDADKLEPVVVSGYRTPEKQQRLYDDKIKEYKKQGYSESEAATLAQQWVAEPGTSEHQLGLAVDINGATYDIYLWLQENSYKYGFIFRYPGNKTHITNVAEEVWHYRYVGKEAAAEIHERGICLEEYLEGQNPGDPSTRGQGFQDLDMQGQPAQSEASFELRNGEWVLLE